MRENLGLLKKNHHADTNNHVNEGPDKCRLFIINRIVAMFS